MKISCIQCFTGPAIIYMVSGIVYELEERDTLTMDSAGVHVRAAGVLYSFPAIQVQEVRGMLS